MNRFEEEVPAKAITFLCFKEKWGPGQFSTSEFAKANEFSHSKANTIIKWGLEHGLIDRVGRGPRVKYLFRTQTDLPLDQAA